MSSHTHSHTHTHKHTDMHTLTLMHTKHTHTHTHRDMHTLTLTHTHTHTYTIHQLYANTNKNSMGYVHCTNTRKYILKTHTKTLHTNVLYTVRYALVLMTCLNHKLLLFSHKVLKILHKTLKIKLIWIWHQMNEWSILLICVMSESPGCILLLFGQVAIHRPTTST